MMIDWGLTWQDILPILMVLYFLLCGAYALDNFYTEGSMQEAIFSFVVCFFLPVIGFLLVWMLSYYTRKGQEHDLSSVMKDGSFFADDLAILRPINREKEMNYVPMEEALSLNNYDFRRKQVMETLSLADTMANVETLRMAMENDDTETSHYASMIIMLLQDQMQTSLQQKSFAWEHSKDDRALGCEYEAELHKFLTGKLMDAQSLRRYYLAYVQLSDHLLQAQKPEEPLLRHRFEIAMSEGDLTTASLLAERYLELYPHSEEAVYEKILLLIRTRDREGLDEFCKSLSRRPVVLTRHVLDYVRFFSQN